MPQSFTDIIAQKRILVCVGSGGVGKTTSAAAIALESANRGQRTLVLTIDPAKRLANSLGLEELGHEVQRVDDSYLTRGERRGESRRGGALWAMMLDQKMAFDEVVHRHASDPAAVRRIMNNPVYDQISRSLAGSQEYAAMAKLHQFDADQSYDLVVVDTPPTAHALDFLDAPQKLAQAIDSPAIEWFRALSTSPDTGRKRWGALGKTGAYVLKRIAKFVGSQFLDDLAIFFTEFNDILGGFKQRAEAVFDLLRQPRVGFVVVCSPDRMAIDEALFFHERLLASSMPFAAFIVNRVHRNLPVAAKDPELRHRLERTPSVSELALGQDDLDDAFANLLSMHSNLQGLARSDEASLQRLIGAAGPGALLCKVPFLPSDVHDVRGLAEIASYVFAD